MPHKDYVAVVRRCKLQTDVLYGPTHLEYNDGETLCEQKVTEHFFVLIPWAHARDIMELGWCTCKKCAKKARSLEDYENAIFEELTQTPHPAQITDPNDMPPINGYEIAYLARNKHKEGK